MLDFGQGKIRRLRHALITTTILASGLTAPVYAQIDAQQGPPPTEVTTDGNGVDLVRGKLTLGRTVAAVGGTSGPNGPISMSKRPPGRPSWPYTSGCPASPGR